MTRVLRLRLVCVSLIIALFTLAQILSVGAGALLPNLPPANPFDAYTALVPGEAISPVSELPCEYEYGYLSRDGNVSYCLHVPDHELIDSISISAIDGVIQRVTFRVRLRYGDLVALFGQAQEKWLFPTIANFEWDGIYASGTMRRASRLSMMTPISRVVFRIENDGLY